MNERDFATYKNADLRDRLIAEAAEVVVLTEQQTGNGYTFTIPNTEQAWQIIQRVNNLLPITIYGGGHIYTSLTYSAASVQQGAGYNTSLYITLPVDLVGANDIDEGTCILHAYYTNNGAGDEMYHLYIDVHTSAGASLLASDVDLLTEGYIYKAINKQLL